MHLIRLTAARVVVWATATAMIGFCAVFVWCLYLFTFERAPIKYTLPLQVDGTQVYHSGGDVVLRIQYCLLRDISYSITQTFVNIETGDRYLTEPLNDLTLTVDGMTGFTDSYRDGKFFCRTVVGVPKHIPKHIPDGRYRMVFDGMTDGIVRKNIRVRYYSMPFTIEGV